MFFNPRNKNNLKKINTNKMQAKIKTALFEKKIFWQKAKNATNRPLWSTSDFYVGRKKIWPLVENWW